MDQTDQAESLTVLADYRRRRSEVRIPKSQINNLPTLHLLISRLALRIISIGQELVCSTSIDWNAGSGAGSLVCQ